MATKPVTGRTTTWTILTFADRLVLYVLVGTAVVLLLGSIGGGDGTSVRITGDGGFEEFAPINGTSAVEVEGPLGTTVVEVAGGEARVASSPCPHQLCVKAGAVRRPGTVVVCVPNKVVVTVVGDDPSTGEPEPTDALTR
jgi:hypothetical protein